MKKQESLVEVKPYWPCIRESNKEKKFTDTKKLMERDQWFFIECENIFRIKIYFLIINLFFDYHYY